MSIKQLSSDGKIAYLIKPILNHAASQKQIILFYWTNLCAVLFCAPYWWRRSSISVGLRSFLLRQRALVEVEAQRFQAGLQRGEPSSEAVEVLAFLRRPKTFGQR